MWPFASATDACTAARQAKLAQQSKAIDATGRQIDLDIPVAEDLPYLSATALQIVHNIDQLEPGWTASRVLHAYIRAAVRAQKLCNPMTEIAFEESLQHAQLLDEHVARVGKVKGPLHGVPISIKDHIDVAGFDTSIGASGRCGKPALQDAAVVDILRKAGALILTKSSIPQTMLAFECQNPVFGRTTNPHSPKLHVPGGSSGGEAALLASDASAGGIGSDIGGSLRIPAHFSGVYGMKITAGRFPGAGVQSSARGFESIVSGTGPMGRSVEDLQLIMDVVIRGAEREGYWRTNTKPMAPIPFRDIQLPNKLRLGFFKKDKLVSTSPACQRAVQASLDVMRQLGHELIEMDDIPTTEAMRLFIALSSADGYDTLLSDIANDPHEAPLFLVDLQRRLGPTVMRGLTNIGSSQDPQSALIASAAGKKTVAELMKYQHERDQFVAKYRQKWWGEMQLDAILCPVQAGPAITCGAGWNLAFLAAATILFNIVDSVAGVVPVTFVDKTKDDLTPDWAAENPPGSFLLERALYGGNRKGGVYNAQQQHGLPVGVQVVGPQFQEEKILKIMAALDSGLGPRGFGPGEFSKRSVAA